MILPLRGRPIRSYIAKHVKQFVARRLIVAGERNVVDISEFIDILVGHTHKIGQTVELGLLHRAVVDYDGIVEVTTLYKVVLDKRLNLAHEHKCAGLRQSPWEIRQGCQVWHIGY